MRSFVTLYVLGAKDRTPLPDLHHSISELLVGFSADSVRSVVFDAARLGLSPAQHAEWDRLCSSNAAPVVAPPRLEASYLLRLVEALRDALKADDRPRVTDAVAHLREALVLARRDSSVTHHQGTVLRLLREALGAIGSAGLIPSSKHEVMGTYAAVVRRAFEPLEHADVRAIQETLRTIAPLVRTPVIHILHEGSTLCGKPGVPGNWGDGDIWVRVEDASKSSCEPCLETFERTADDA